MQLLGNSCPIIMTSTNHSNQYCDQYCAYLSFTMSLTGQDVDMKLSPLPIIIVAEEQRGSSLMWYLKVGWILLNCMFKNFTSAGWRPTEANRSISTWNTRKQNQLVCPPLNGAHGLNQPVDLLPTGNRNTNRISWQVRSDSGTGTGTEPVICPQLEHKNRIGQWFRPQLENSNWWFYPRLWKLVSRISTTHGAGVVGDSEAQKG